MTTRLAALDLGSNSFRLEIGRLEGDDIVTEAYFKEGVRIAAGLDEKGALTEPTQQRALETLSRFAEQIKNFPTDHVRAVGTQTLRVATNRQEFINKAADVLGYPIEIIPGQEEARLVFLGCSHRLPPSAMRRFVVDIGGGSTELIIGTRHDVSRCESFHVGCVALMLEYFPDGILSEERFEEAKLCAMAELNEARARYAPELWDRAYGSSGTMDAVLGIARALNLTLENDCLTATALREIRKRLVAWGHVDNIEITDLHHSRREVFAGGLAVLEAVFDVFDVKAMHFSPGALRAGLLFEQLDRLRGYDLREKSVRRLLEVSGIDTVRAHCVADFARQLLLSANSISGETVKRLTWAALLHQAGTLISHNRFHRLGAYIVDHFDLQGFSLQDRDWVSSLVLGHRGRLFKIQNRLENRHWLLSLAALRLAVLFYHSVEDASMPKSKLTVQNHRLTLEVADSTWFESHPLTHFLLRQEVKAWKAVQYEFDLRNI